ncbi:DUF559 domain-containing protein [Solwaraspora sp. WMMA2056]|uniref:endonuclease domain-containing protein n=1 Tax=Solwaraspora sp. WMMA2056 TaxID=3015161 RepID=UPI00259B124F|nr:DUF559 domain-containing protein [Solwaraspora sp. WMMA2056]WJK42214.1 DUF559 domain-containing protein [Solwaraspora sp. WMMA2056]
MSRPAKVPRELSFEPFSGSRAVAAGLLTWRMLDGPAWRRLFRDVYVHADSYDPDDHRMWCIAATLRLPRGAAVYGLSAAYLWGVDLLPRRAGSRPTPVHVALPKTARPEPHERVSYVYRALERQDITTFTGVPLTTEVRTAFDLGRSLPRAEALGALDALLRHRATTREKLTAYVDAHPGRRKIKQLRELLMLAEPLSESPMESRLRLLPHDAGLPKPTPQYEVRTPAPGSTGSVGSASGGKFLARVDLAYPQWRIAIEYEGDHHRERATFRRDVHRFNALRAAGWLALRFTADDVLRRSEQLVRTVRQAIAERAD